jgi:hypothetical protein
VVSRGGSDFVGELVANASVMSGGVRCAGVFGADGQGVGELA